MSYLFPVLKSRELLECLAELRIDVTAQDLKAPTGEKMKAAYQRFVQDMMGEDESSRQPKLAAMDNFAYPELHEESISEHTSLTNILKLLRSVGIYDVSIRDFISPEPKRTRVILSGLINFAKFREERAQAYSELNEKTEQLIETKEQMYHGNAQLQAQLSSLQAKRDQELPHIQAVEEQNTTLAAKINELNKEHAEQRDAVKQLKQEYGQINDDIANQKFCILNAKQENEKLRSQIVKSPEKLKKSLEQMGINLEEGKKELTELNAQYRDLQARADTLQKVATKLDKRIGQLDEVEAESKKCKQLFKEIKEAQTKLEKDEENLRNLTHQEQHFKKQISQGQDKLFRLQRSFEQKRHSVNLALDQVQQQKLTEMRAFNKQKQKVDANNCLIAQKQQEMDSARKEHEAEMLEVRQKFQALGEQVKVYHQQIQKAMSNGSAFSVRA